MCRIDEINNDIKNKTAEVKSKKEGATYEKLSLLKIKNNKIKEKIMELNAHFEKEKHQIASNMK